METALAHRKVAEMQKRCACVEENFENFRAHNQRLWDENVGLSAALVEARNALDVTRRDFEAILSSLILANKQMVRQTRTDASLRRTNIVNRKVEYLQAKCAAVEAYCERMREEHKRGREEMQGNRKRHWFCASERCLLRRGPIGWARAYRVGS